MSTITTTYSLSVSEFQQPSADTTLGKRPWGFWATLGWLVVATAALVAVPILLLVLDLFWTEDVTRPITVAISIAAAIMVLVLAARGAGWSARDYLALNWPQWRYIFIGLGLVLAVKIVSWGLDYLFPSNDGQWIVEKYLEVAEDPIALALFWIAAVVVAPIVEEIIFRGFIMRGWMSTQLGVVGAIVLSSLLFAAIHTQYDLVGMSYIFVVGLSLGLMRWLSGSTVLAILMHAANNLSVFLLLALFV